MTQAQLASRIGVTDKAVSKWERDLSYPDVALIPRLADILGVTANDLLTRCLKEGQPSRLLRILDMSHDIRTPLHIMLGCAKLAELHHEDTKLLMHYLESIRISGEYLLESIDQLMQVAYQDQEKIEKKRHPANIQELGEYLNRKAETGEDVLEGYDFSGKRVLIVDDISMNREIVAEILKQTGASVEFAEDGAVCVEMVQAAPEGYYDLILMDIMMPKMNGLEATRRIRQLPEPKKASVPIIAVSADVYKNNPKEALEAGMNDFTEKPIFMDKLFETLKRYLT